MDKPTSGHLRVEFKPADQNICLINACRVAVVSPKKFMRYDEIRV